MGERKQMNKQDAIAFMLEHTHSLVSEQKARKIAKAFGIMDKLRCVRVWKSDLPGMPKGLTLRGNAKRMNGAAIKDIAEELCRRLNIRYVEMFGRGSQVRECCAKMIEHFQKED